MKTVLETDPRSFLTEFFLDEARENYTATLLSADDEEYHLSFIPRDSRAELSRVDVRIGREKGFVMDISYTDLSGSTTSYLLENPEVDVREEKHFRFTLPEGMDLLDLTADHY
ncbi:MAG: outer membrane lipoprotein carrier protein LolA [Candidatus Glassbacteria bacterium]